MRGPLVALLVGLQLLAGCATTDCATALGDRSITPAAAAAAPHYAGRLVQWGGVLIEARNLHDHTELEVLGYPLGECAQPRLQTSSIGRFVIVRPGYLETADLAPGRLITATGCILGAEAGTVGDTAYRFALLESYKPYIWPAEPEDHASVAIPVRPWVSIGIGSGRGGVGGGIGVSF